MKYRKRRLVAWGAASVSRTVGSWVAVLAAGAGVVADARAAAVVYVDARATGAGDGSSWENAYTDLQAALDAAGASAGTITEIRVAQGVYRPSKRTDPDDPRSATFELVSGIALRGGYAGVGAVDPDLRGGYYYTALSGDLNGDDTWDFLGNTENAYHILVGYGLSAETVLDRFEIRGGNSYPAPVRYGAGLYLENSALLVESCYFTANWSGWNPYRALRSPDGEVAHDGAGGALAVVNEAQTVPINVSGCSFEGNGAYGPGGGLFVRGGSVNLVKCGFRSNSATYGGGAIGVYSATEVNVSETSFWFNSAVYEGGAYYQTSTAPGSSVRIAGSDFEGNSASQGGAITAGSTSLEVLGCAFSWNEATDAVGGVYTSGRWSNVRIEKSVFRNNRSRYVGGVLIADSETARVQSSTFADNSSESFGGGMVLGATSGRVDDCVFTGNSGATGGALVIGGEDIVVECCRFEMNRAEEGGAVELAARRGVVKDSLFRGNVAASGGAMAVTWGDSEIRGCTFHENSGNDGGGLWGHWSAVAVIESLFEQNEATRGGAMFALDGQWMAVKSRFQRNVAVNGGGICASGESSGQILGCTIADNEAENGGGLYTSGGSVYLKSAALTGNRALHGGGIFHGGGLLQLFKSTLVGNTAEGLAGGLLTGGEANISHSILWGNTAFGGEADEYAQINDPRYVSVATSSVQGWCEAFGSASMTCGEPGLVRPVDSDGPNGPETVDIHLRPDSPLIEAGEWIEPCGRDSLQYPCGYTADIDGHSMRLCERFDIGADEFGIGDYTCDRRVDAADAAALSGCLTGLIAGYFIVGCEAFDFDADFDVDLRDVAGFQRVFEGSP